MRKAAVALSIVALAVGFAATAAAQSVPAGYQVSLLAGGLWSPKGITAPLHRGGAGPFGHDLYVAESGLNQIVQVDRATGTVTFFASTLPFGSFPVGVGFYGGPFARNLYVGVAFGGGVLKMDASGGVSQFALPGASIAGLDFGRGHYGYDLYAGEWTAGNIWRIDPAGNASLFASCVNCQTRYLKFSHGNRFGTMLYFSDFIFGDIYQVDPLGNLTLFASTGSPCLEGFDFSPGGAFGHYLYAGDVCTGDIFQVAANGAVNLWASGFPGVADIHFAPGKRGGFTMYLVDGFSAVYAVSKK